MSDEAKNEEDMILPDLPDELSGEHLMMQQRVFRANENSLKSTTTSWSGWIHLQNAGFIPHMLKTTRLTTRKLLLNTHMTVNMAFCTKKFEMLMA